ncbi:MAG: AAA family ATPase [Polyangiaceae bacterium]|nr:AAA family ATPase [Polyangiaceae bacterium]
MLKRLFVDNFRGLVNFEFRPGQLSLLLGHNGSGKTTVFNVLGALRDLVVLGAPASDLFRYSATKWDKRDIQRFELDVIDEGGTYHYVLEVLHPAKAPGTAVIRTETVSLDGAALYRFSDGEVHLYYDDQSPGPVFPFRPDQSFLTNIEPGRTQRTARLAQFKDFLVRLGILQPNPFAIDVLSRQDQNFLARNGSNFAQFFDYLNDERPDVRTDLERRLGEAVPGFRNFLFKRVGDAKALMASLGDPGQTAEFNLGELSEGQRVLGILYAAACGLMRKGSLLCFDEPDNFVSLSEIQLWLQTLRDAVDQNGGQALVISHHPEVIDYLALDSVWRFERTSGPVMLVPLEVGEESELRLSEIIARST